MIRKVEKSEIKEFVKIQVEAYPGFFNGSLEEIVGMVKVLEEYTENPVCFGYFENDKIVAGMILYIFEMNYNNEKKVLVGGLGSLAVALTHKKEKIAYKMIRFYQTYSEKKGCKLLALYPFNDRFYSKFGFAKGVIQYKYNFKPSQLITKTTNQKLRHSERSDLNKICDCVNRIAENKHGMYYIHSKDIKKYQKMKTQKCFVYEEDNLIKGFIIIDSKSNSKDNPLDNTLIVKEMYYEDSKVLNIILKFLKNQEEAIHNYLIPVIETIKEKGSFKTKPLDGILVHIALKRLREEFPEKYVAVKTNVRGDKYVLVNEYRQKQN